MDDPALDKTTVPIFIITSNSTQSMITYRYQEEVQHPVPKPKLAGSFECNAT